MKQDQFRDRYIIRLGSSIILAVLNFAIQAMLPRAFSVDEYGFYSYNLNIFTAAVSIANLSMPSALSSKFSKRNDEIGLVKFYFKFWIVMVTVLNVGVVILFGTSFARDSFAGQSLLTVLLGLEAAVLTALLSDDISIYDAMAISRYPAAMQIVMKIIVTALIAVGFFTERLNLTYFYISQVSVTGIIVFILIRNSFREQKRLFPETKDSSFKAYAKEYYEYCRPLVLSTLFSQLMVMLMNWSLMHWSGASEQAMFGAAWQLNTLVGFVFSPYCILSRREFAVVADKADEMKHRYEQALKMMMWITSYFALFIGVNAEWILRIIYGDKYDNAITVTLLIMFYTVFQAWGQISGAFLHATERTKIHAIVSVCGQFIMLGCVFLFQIPNFIWKDSLGSVGIALTYLISNILSVYITLFINSRILGMSFWRDMLIQVLPISLCSVLALGLKYVLNYLIDKKTIGLLILKTGVSGVVYTLVLAGFIIMFPALVGLRREQLLNLIKRKNRRG